MERPVKFGSQPAGGRVVCVRGEAVRAGAEAADATVDHSDIRGSSLARRHCRDPSQELPRDYGRESSVPWEDLVT